MGKCPVGRKQQGRIFLESLTLGKQWSSGRHLAGTPSLTAAPTLHFVEFACRWKSLVHCFIPSLKALSAHSKCLKSSIISILSSLSNITPLSPPYIPLYNSRSHNSNLSGLIPIRTPSRDDADADTQFRTRLAGKASVYGTILW